MTIFLSLNSANSGKTFRENLSVSVSGLMQMQAQEMGLKSFCTLNVDTGLSFDVDVDFDKTQKLLHNLKQLYRQPHVFLVEHLID